MSPLFYFFLLHKRREHQSRPPITWRVPQMKYSMSLIGLALFRVGVTTDRMTLASKACQCVRCLLYCLHGPLYSLDVRDPRPEVAGMCSDLSAPMHGVLGAGAESDLLARIGGKNSSSGAEARRSNWITACSSARRGSRFAMQVADSGQRG